MRHNRSARSARRLQEHAFKISRVAQRLNHRTALSDDGSEVVLTGHAVAESCAETVATEALEFCDLDHHVILRLPRSVSMHEQPCQNRYIERNGKAGHPFEPDELRVDPQDRAVETRQARQSASASAALRALSSGAPAATKAS